MRFQRLLAAALLFLLATAACATAPTHSNPDQPLPTKPAPSSEKRTPDVNSPVGRDSEERRESEPAVSAKTQRIIDAMQDLYNSGLEAHKAGRFEEARDYFDQAVETALNSGLDIDSEPPLKKVYEELLENIDGLEGDLYQDQERGEAGEQTPKEELKDINSYLSPEEAEKERQKVESASRAVRYDIPLELNDQVLTFIEAFQVRMRGPFEAGLRRSGKYLEMIKRILVEEGLPEDLAYMAHQESAFKTNAYSRARAKGLWQFIGPTARKYGLKRDDWVDERSDPEKSTRAAAAYLKDLYSMFGDWYLAMAAYNAGEGKIQRSMRKTGATDFWSLAQHRRVLRQETRNYVPAILASIVVDKAPEEYGFYVDPEEGLVYDQVNIDSPTDLTVAAECAGTTLETIRMLNPELRTMATPPYAGGYSLKVPVGSGEAFLEKYAAVPKERRLQWTRHRVQRGETLALVARRYGASVRAIMSANSLRSAHRLRVGQSLVIPTSGYVPARISSARLEEDAPTYEKGEKVIHRVRRGETLQRIASKYRTNIASLRQWNGLSGSAIRPGQRLMAYYAIRAASPQESPDPFKVASGSLEYRVRSGDTLFGIAQRYGMTVEQLRSANNLGRRSVIRPGDRLRVFGSSPPSASPSSGAAAQPSS